MLSSLVCVLCLYNSSLSIPSNPQPCSWEIKFFALAQAIQSRRAHSFLVRPTMPYTCAYHSPNRHVLDTYVFYLPLSSLRMEAVSYSSLHPKHLVKCLYHSTESMFIEWVTESITQTFFLSTVRSISNYILKYLSELLTSSIWNDIAIL